MKTLHLIIVERGRPVERRFTQFPIFLGRHPSNALSLDAPTVSRFHAEIDVEGNDVVVRDKGTQNGTLVQDGADLRLLRKSSFQRERELEFIVEGVHFRATLSETRVSELTPAFLGTAWRAANRLLRKGEQALATERSEDQLVYAQRALDEIEEAQSMLRGALRFDLAEAGEDETSDGLVTYLDASIALVRRLHHCLAFVRMQGIEADPAALFTDTVVTRATPSEAQSRPTLSDIEQAPTTPEVTGC